MGQSIILVSVYLVLLTSFAGEVCVCQWESEQMRETETGADAGLASPRNLPLPTG